MVFIIIKTLKPQNPKYIIKKHYHLRTHHLCTCSVGSSIGASAVPGRAEYASFFSDFSQIWVQATGGCGCSAARGDRC